MKHKIIHKFPLKLIDRQTFNIDGRFEPLSVQLQGEGTVSEQLCMWALRTVEDSQVKESVVDIIIVGTGHTAEMYKHSFVSTVQWGSFVWHIFANVTPVYKKEVA